VASPDQIEAWLDSVVILVTGPAWCSGVVIGPDTIATAYHCVATGLRTKVRTRDGQEAVGRMVAARPREDLALVHVEGLEGLRPLAVHPDRPRRGVRVYGLGHPFGPAAEQSEALEGTLLWSVTEGIVSAAGPRLIQTDAALNPGNSGGPVVDLSGRIVGITSRKLDADNVAFLASAEVLRALLDERPKPFPLGGTVGFGLSYLGGSTLLAGDFDGREADVGQALELTASVVLRERLRLSGGIGISGGSRLSAAVDGRAYAPAAEVTAALRQRFGRGTWSTTLDVGGGAMTIWGYTATFDAETGTFLIPPATPISGPTASARLGMAGVGLRGVALFDQPGDPTWLVGIDLEVPGVIKTF
jgi:hypothetical protein